MKVGALFIQEGSSKTKERFNGTVSGSENVETGIPAPRSDFLPVHTKCHLATHKQSLDAAATTNQ
jgi:hypothetical protein